MGSSGALSDHQPLGNLSVAEPLPDEHRYFSLSECQLVRSLSGPWLRRWAAHADGGTARVECVGNGLVQAHPPPLLPGRRRGILAEGPPDGCQAAVIPAALGVLHGDS